MVQLKALTYACWIQFKIMLFAYVSGHTEHLVCVLANEPPLYLRRKKLSMQYCLKLSATSQNPAYSAVFAGKFKSFFNNID